MNSSSSALSPAIIAKPSGETAGTKDRTWPASVCVDPTDASLWNVRGIDGIVAFTPGVPSRRIAQQACNAINAHFDHGRDR